MQNNLARLLEGLAANQISLISEDHPRWWEYPVGPPTPIPINVQYACDESLGSPSIANCEAALYEFVQSGDIILDPVSGPIIKVTGKLQDTLFNLHSGAELDKILGNCAIAVGANERHSTTWDMLRSVAETLIARCISNPSSGALGGTAISQATGNRGRSLSVARRKEGKASLRLRPLEKG